MAVLADRVDVGWNQFQRPRKSEKAKILKVPCKHAILKCGYLCNLHFPKNMCFIIFYCLINLRPNNKCSCQISTVPLS